MLLFEVGLETNLRSFRTTGASAVLVGTLGVVFSLAAGFGASALAAGRFAWVLTENARAQPLLFHVFVGAVLTATSVGITARVLTDLRKIRSPEGQIILGAAVFDDVLGLVVLALVGGILLHPGTLDGLAVARIVGVALLFFFAAILVGSVLSPRLVHALQGRVRDEHVHVAGALAIMLALAYLATRVGLAGIVGAFAAGLGLSGSRHRDRIFGHVRPLGGVFVGFFFVTLGARVDLSQLDRSSAPLLLLMTAVLALAGILGKLLAGLGVVGVAASRLVVGVGMVPRGEVGLIFALYGLTYGLLANWQYSALILVVLATTVVTPPWLQALRNRFGAAEPDAVPSHVEEVVNP